MPCPEQFAAEVRVRDRRFDAMIERQADLTGCVSSDPGRRSFGSADDVGERVALPADRIGFVPQVTCAGLVRATQ
jgi:hypothetical protein